MKYLFDNDISHKFAKMLDALDVEVVALRDEFPPDTKDPVFLAALKGTDTVLVSANGAMRTNAIERKLLREANIISLYLGPFWGKMKFWQQAEWLVRRWPTIQGFAEGVTKGTCAEIKQNGKATIYPL